MDLVLIQNNFLSMFNILVKQPVVKHYFLSEICISRSFQNILVQFTQNLFHFWSSLEEQLRAGRDQIAL
jgi:hypothetical protein